MICGSGGSKSRLAKAAGAEPAGQMSDEKMHAVVARSAFQSENVQNTLGADHFWELRCRKSARRCGAKHISKWKCTKHTSCGPLLAVEMSKKCTPLWREAHFEVKMYKTHQVRTTFGSCDVKKVHAVVARSTFPSENVQSTPVADHFWQLRCRKSARRCGAKHISKSKCTRHYMFAPLLEVQMSKKCTPLWREAHFEVKMLKPPAVRTTFGGSDVASLRFTTYTLDCTTHQYITLHYTTLHYTTLHYTTLPSTTLHYITLHSPTLQLQLHNSPPLHSTTLHYTTLHYNTLHYTTLHYATFHYTSLHYTTLHYNYNYTTTLHYTPLDSTTLNYITLHYITLHYTPLHYITLHYTPQHYNYNYTTTLHYTPLHSTTLHYTTLHYTTLHYTTLHYTTLPSTTLHHITLHYTPLHYNYNYNCTTTLHYTPLHSTTPNYTKLHLHYITLHYTPLHYITLPSTTPHYTKLHYTTLHYTTLHYIPLHSTTLHYITLHYITLNDTAPPIDR